MQIKNLFRRVLYSGVVGTELTNTNVSIFITSDAGNTWREVQSNKWFQNDWNWPLFVFTKTHARKEHNFTPATSDWRWGECHWELHTAASFHLFTYLFFYIFVSQTSKKKKKDSTPGLVQDTLSRSQRNKQAQRFLPSQQDFREQHSATFHNIDSLFEKPWMIDFSTQYI